MKTLSKTIIIFILLSILGIYSYLYSKIPLGFLYNGQSNDLIELLVLILLFPITVMYFVNNFIIGFVGDKQTYNKEMFWKMLLIFAVAYLIMIFPLLQIINKELGYIAQINLAGKWNVSVKPLTEVSIYIKLLFYALSIFIQYKIIKSSILIKPLILIFSIIIINVLAQIIVATIYDPLYYYILLKMAAITISYIAEYLGEKLISVQN